VAAVPPGTSKVRDFLPRVLEASSVGWSWVPKREVAFARSASLTFWKSRKRMCGFSQIIHSR
jgi:hypothetical protein